MDFLCRLLGRNLLFLLYFRTSGVTRLQSLSAYIVLHRNRLADLYLIHGATAFIHRFTSSFQHLFQPPVHNLSWSDYLIITGGYIHYSHPKKEVINLDINKEITGKKQIRVAAISDIHIGYGTTKERLQRYVRMIQAEKPDLILISGDLIDSNLKPVREQHLEQELNQLQAPLGVFMIPGNHEYISGIGKSRTFIQQQTSIQWLQDSVVTLANGIQLIGRDDRHNPRRKSIAQLTDTLSSNRPLFLLDHQPYQLDESAQANIDLQFSGHTHNGQVWPLNLITGHLFEVSHGYKQKGNTHIYVSSGLSLWGPPFRIGPRSEMVIFDINFQ